MAPAALNIRLARPAEAATITSLAFRSKASNGYDAAFMAACRAELTFDARSLARGETWLCEDRAGRVLGFFDLRCEAGTAEVYALFVEPERKGFGVGRALWARLEARAAALGAGRIGVDSDPAAVPFYLRMGMAPAGEAPSGSIPGRQLPRLIKVLPPSPQAAPLTRDRA
jgi:GNAT superfamily N-acetyltransferase